MKEAAKRPSRERTRERSGETGRFPQLAWAPGRAAPGGERSIVRPCSGWANEGSGGAWAASPSQRTLGSAVVATPFTVSALDRTHDRYASLPEPVREQAAGTRHDFDGVAWDALRAGLRSGETYAVVTARGKRDRFRRRGHRRQDLRGVPAAAGDPGRPSGAGRRDRLCRRRSAAGRPLLRSGASPLHGAPQVNDAGALVVANGLLVLLGAGLLPLIGMARTWQGLIGRLPVAWLGGIAAAESSAALATGRNRLRLARPRRHGSTRRAGRRRSASRRIRARRGGAPGDGWPAATSWQAGWRWLVSPRSHSPPCAFAIKPLVGDGWAIWGMKAHALAALGPRESVLAGAAYPAAHLEYPLGIPSVVSLPLDLADHYSSTLVVAQTAARRSAGLLSPSGGSCGTASGR